VSLVRKTEPSRAGKLKRYIKRPGPRESDGKKRGGESFREAKMRGGSELRHKLHLECQGRINGAIYLGRRVAAERKGEMGKDCMKEVLQGVKGPENGLRAKKRTSRGGRNEKGG